MIINLTPHNINIIKDDNVLIFESKCCARCTQTDEVIQTIDGIDVIKTTFGKVENLPEPSDGTYYIVSAIVAKALCGVRNDLIVPSGTVRNEQGQIIGCKNFAKI